MKNTLKLTVRQLKPDCCNVIGNVSPDRDEVIQQIKGMMTKEKSVYKCNDYILTQTAVSPVSQRNTSNPAQEFILDEVCRQKMCEWSYRIVDHFDGRRGLVAIAQNFVDRFLDQNRCDSTAFKLVSITALYLAVKVHNPKPFSMTSLANLSRGEYLVEDITDMEEMLLRELDWQLCPPTAATFCGYFHTLISSKVSESGKIAIQQRSYYFCELAVMDYSIILSANQSEIAFAAILNSLAGVHSSLISIECKEMYLREIEECSGMDRRSERVRNVQGKLWALYHRSTQYIFHDSRTKMFPQDTKSMSDIPVNHNQVGSLKDRGVLLGTGNISSKPSYYCCSKE